MSLNYGEDSEELYVFHLNTNKGTVFRGTS